MDRVLFRSLPYPHDSRLVSVGLKAPLDANEFKLAMDYVEWRKFASPFEQMGSMLPGAINCDFTEQNPVRMACARVDAHFLPTFGIQPILGHNFTPEECLPHALRVALLSYSLWRSRYAGDSKIVGRSVSLDGEPVEIIGVLPSQFEMPTLVRADLLIPAARSTANDSSHVRTAETRSDHSPSTRCAAAVIRSGDDIRPSRLSQRGISERARFEELGE